MTTETGTVPPAARAERHRGRTAVIDAEGTFSYGELLDFSARVAAELLQDQDDLHEQPVAFLITPGFPWVAALWGIWRAGGIAVPLPSGSPAPELEYLLDDTGSKTILFDAASQAILSPLAQLRGLRMLSVAHAFAPAPAPAAGSAALSCAGNVAPLPKLPSARSAMILYTSGTTSRPKGVVTTHDNITAQITALTGAWEWTAEDRILLCLPLHHVHGIINVVSCALWSGAVCEMLPRFDARAVLERIASGRLTLFMAVPTVYTKLIAEWEASSPESKAAVSSGCRKLRLMVSGSAALPVTTLERWKQISGHTLLERYGMTEIGMALANPLHGTRVPGSVGTPLPTVEVQLVNETGTVVEPGSPGEIEVRGPSVFKEYWGKPDATRDAFRNGWFRTGDTAVMEMGVYRILGRTNIDIIKTGGHKVSALEVEEQLREHPAVAECAVVGVPDPEWGERVAVTVVLREGGLLDLEQLRSWSKQRLALHKIPSRLLVTDALPRNAMGKVIKPALVNLFKPVRESG